MSADWLWMTGALDETPENRALGLACDLEMVKRADEVWLVGERISEGMRVEAAEAFRVMKPVFDYTALTRENEPPPGAWASAELFRARRLWLPDPALDEDEEDHGSGGEG